MGAQVDRCTQKATQMGRTEASLRAAGPNGWWDSNRATTLTRNDLDSDTPRKQFSESAEPSGPCFLVPWSKAQAMDQANMTGPVKLFKVLGEGRTYSLKSLSGPQRVLPILPSALQVGPCHEQMPRF